MRFRCGRACVRARWLTLLGLSLACPAMVGRAEPTVRVRAASKLEAHFQPESDGAQGVSGRLTDDLDAPLQGRTVTVYLDGPDGAPRQLAVTTDADGRFDTRVRAGASDEISATFAGEALHAAARVAAVRSPPSQPLELQWGIAAGAALDLSEPRQQVEIGLLPIEAARGLLLNLSTDAGPIGRAPVDASGRARFDFDSERLGGPRRTRLVVQAARRGRGSSLRAERTVVVRGTASLSLSAAAGGAAGEVHVAGMLRAGGTPAPGKAVTITIDGVPVHTCRTDAQGRFDTTFGVDRMGGGDRPLPLVARFDSDAPWIASARSEVVTVRLPPRIAPHPAWLLVPVMLCLLALLRYRAPAGEGPEGTRDRRRGATRAGFTGAAGQRISLGGQSALAGRVVDLDHGEPIPDARIRITPAGGPPTVLPVGPDGTFTSEALPAGHYDVSASAPHYCEERTSVSMPHRGQWSDLRVCLQRLRSRAYEAYRPAGDAIGPGEGAAAVLTPREILEAHQERHGETADVADLVARVEQAAYGRRPPSAEEIDEIRRRSEEVDPSKGAVETGEDSGASRRATIPHQR